MCKYAGFILFASPPCQIPARFTEQEGHSMFFFRDREKCLPLTQSCPRLLRRKFNYACIGE